MKNSLKKIAIAGLAAAIMCSGTVAMAAKMILNEYNAVLSTGYLKSGASDTYFGIRQGNGGDWMEFVTIEDNLDIRGWSISTFQAGAPDATIVIPNLSVFSCLRSGTILTIAEDVATDLSYDPIYDPGDPNIGDWWINYQASFSMTDNTQSNFQVWIYDKNDDTVFGPAGEGIYPLSGVGSDEVFKLEANPSASIAGDSLFYKDGTSSTFGGANLWSSGTIKQDFSQLRSVATVPEPSSILALVLGIGSLAGFRKVRK